jgi:hypothetical protein
MWETRNIEKITRSKLINDCGEAEGESKYGIYTTARSAVLKDIANHIMIAEPFLTDHGPVHIANVLDNAERLLGDDIKEFSGLELYCLVLSILFHDVGNIFNRLEHQKTAAKVISFVWPDKDQRLEEIIVINQVVKAHCGIATDGTKDTLKEVESTDQLNGQRVRLREIAAIVRFADELAEGPQRTSLFMITQKKYSGPSQVYHQYANITNIFIDRNNKRIALKYNFNITDNIKKQNVDKIAKDLQKLLEFTYKRIVKVDQERQYAKFYSSYLPFNETVVSLNFVFGDYPDTLGLPRLSLTDLIIPGNSPKNISDYDSNYKIASIMRKIRQQLQ